MGRRSKKTKALVADLLQLIGGGGPYELCCQAVGISRESFCEWRRSDPAFAKEVEQASARGALSRLSRIDQHGGEDWRALGWMLERRHPEHFSRPETLLNVTAQAGVINGNGAGQSIQTLVITDLEFLGLRAHSAYRHEPGDSVNNDVAPELRGRLVREQHENVSIISESQKEARAQRSAAVRAKTVAMFAARETANNSPPPVEVALEPPSTTANGAPELKEQPGTDFHSAVQQMPPSIRDFFEE